MKAIFSKRALVDSGLTGTSLTRQKPQRCFVKKGLAPDGQVSNIKHRSYYGFKPYAHTLIPCHYLVIVDGGIRASIIAQHSAWPASNHKQGARGTKLDNK